MRELGDRMVSDEINNKFKQFELWRKWTLEHKVTPSQHSEDEEEKKIASNMSNSLTRMKRKSEKYRSILEEYNELYNLYGRRKDSKTVEEHFVAWKEWTLGHEITPSQHSKDEEEKKIAVGMLSTLERIKKDPEKYRQILEGYKELCEQYGRRKANKTLEEHFATWKEWTLDNERMPSKKSKNSEEHKVARNMTVALRKMRANPEMYRDVLEEYNQVHSKYTVYKNNKTVEEHFEAWKEWTLEHKATPSQQSKDKEEKTVAIGIMHTLQKTKKEPDKYRQILEGYKELCEQYGRRKANKTAEEHFEAWKEWTLGHKVTPSQYSKYEQEKKIAKNMINTLRKMRANPEMYRDVLEEYQDLKNQYNIRRIKKLQKEKQELLSLVRALKHDVYDSEQLYIESQYTVSRIMDKKIQKREGPGE